MIKIIVRLFAVVAAVLTVVSFVEITPEYKQSFSSRMQAKAHLVCAGARPGQAHAQWLTLVGPAQVHMNWAEESIPHPEFCEPGTELGSTCMMARRQYTLVSCTYSL